MIKTRQLRIKRNVDRWDSEIRGAEHPTQYIGRCPMLWGHSLRLRQRIRAGELVEQVNRFSVAGQLANRFLELLRR